MDSEESWSDCLQGHEDQSSNSSHKKGSSTQKSLSPSPQPKLVSSKPKYRGSASVELIGSQEARVAIKTLLVKLSTEFSYCNFPQGYLFSMLMNCNFSFKAAKQKINDCGIDHIGEINYCVVESSKNREMCQILCEEFDIRDMEQFGCGHYVERSCMKEYLENAINTQGQACLKTTCPDVGCLYLTFPAIVEKICQKHFSDLFFRHLVTAYFNQSKNIISCPGPDCDRAFVISEEIIEEEGGFPQIDYLCSCSHLICLKCKLFSHSPLSCEDYFKWQDNTETTFQTLNEHWLKQNCKKCPKCKADIQKNEGCMHMTCMLCKHNFCWLCMDPWEKHGAETGGFYRCNVYEAQKETNKKTKEDEDLERLQFFTDRYMQHKVSIKLSQKKYKDLLLMLDPSSETDLYNNHSKLINALDFYVDCMKTVVLLRAFIACTYPLGYKINNKKEYRLFAMNQYMLEFALEKLDKCIEDNKPDSFFTKGDFGLPAFAENYLQIKTSMTALKLSLQTQFENARKEFTNTTFIKPSSLAPSNKSSETQDHLDPDPKSSPESKSPSPELTTSKPKSHRPKFNWNCSHCTYYNKNNNNKLCTMCGMMGRPK